MFTIASAQALLLCNTAWWRWLWLRYHLACSLELPPTNVLERLKLYLCRGACLNRSSLTRPSISRSLLKCSQYLPRSSSSPSYLLNSLHQTYMATPISANGTQRLGTSRKPEEGRLTMHKMREVCRTNPIVIWGRTAFSTCLQADHPRIARALLPLIFPYLRCSFQLGGEGF